MTLTLTLIMIMTFRPQPHPKIVHQTSQTTNKMTVKKTTRLNLSGLWRALSNVWKSLRNKEIQAVQ
jgi:hypothetical protein